MHTANKMYNFDIHTPETAMYQRRVETPKGLLENITLIA